jgi:DinB superfamily
MSSEMFAAPEYVTSQTLTLPELEQARLYLQQTLDGVVGAIKGLSEEQWTFRPSPDQWSVAEIVEHIIFVQERVLGPIRDQLADAPPVAAGYDYRYVDEVVVYRFPNRLTKFPSRHRPTGYLARSEALDCLVKNYAQLTDYVESTPDLRQHAIEAAPLKAVSQGAYEHMDGYQWILAVAAHTERHTKQILEVKANPDFPQTEERLHLYDEWPRR